MDELLELMNDDEVDLSSSTIGNSSNEAHHYQSQNSNSVSTDNRKKNNNNNNKRCSIKKKQDNSTTSNRPVLDQRKNNKDQYQPGVAARAGASIDDQLGIRMTNRSVSSSDLSDLVNDYMYYSPSMLSSMSLKRLNMLLQDPSPIIDTATVTGKLLDNFVTVGIVFKNSGTRISKQGRGSAFCILTIGSNLHSGPSVSVFLFGNVYGKFCNSCKPGQVIAVMGAPKLLPANNTNTNSNNRGGGNKNNTNSNNNTDNAVTLSVYDVNQLQVIATARDFGTCKSATATTTCKNYTDKRISEYCDYHRRRGVGQQLQGGGGKQQLNNNSNKFQQVKSQHQEHQVILVSQSSRSNNNRFLNNHRRQTTSSVTNNNRTMMTNGAARLATTNSNNNNNNQSNHMTDLERRRIGNNSMMTSSSSSNGFFRNRNANNTVPKVMSKLLLSQNNKNRFIMGKNTKSNNIIRSNKSSVETSNSVKKLAAKRQRGEGTITTTRVVVGTIGNNSSGRNGIISTITRGTKRPKKKNIITMSVDSDWMEEAIAMSKTKGGPVSSIGNSNRRGFSLTKFTENNNNNTNAKQQRIRPSKATTTNTTTTTGSDTTTTTASNHDTSAKSINTAGLDFDGSVCIPKATALFQRANVITTTTEYPPSSSTRIVTPTNESNHKLMTETTELLQQQAQIAQRIVKEGRKGTNSTTTSGSNKNNNSNRIKSVLNPYKQSISRRTNNNPFNSSSKDGSSGSSNKGDDVNDFLAAMGGDANFDEEKIRNAKSRFADEAAADDYAKQRRKIVELEKLEESQESRNKKSNNNNNNNNSNRITKTWYCKSCQQQYNYKPKNCIAARHDIKTRHEIKKVTTKDEQRTKMHKKSTEDGGLVLGSGLDWSSRNKFNN